MRRSIATVCLSGTLREKLESVAAERFDAVEIFENDLLFFDGTPRQVRTLAADLGLKIVLFQPFRDLEGVSDEQFRRNLDRLERKFDLMQELGAPQLLVCSNARPDAVADDGRAAAQLFEAAERAAKRGLRIGFEALAWGTQVRTFGHAWRIVEQAGHPHLGLIVDSFHTLALDDDPAPIAAIPGDKIHFVQLADAPKLKMDVISWSRHFRCFPGQGEFDVAGFMAAVIAAGYVGPISLEIFNDEFRASPTRRTALDAMRSLLLTEEQVRARLAAADHAPAGPAAISRRPARRVELFDPPPPPDVDGVSYLEVAVDETAGAGLGQFLRALGFTRAGRHRSKAVTLYRQGGIHFVVNEERDSFAHAYFLMHGPSVCALAVRVADDIEAVNRAEAFGCSRFQGRVGTDQLPVPAIRSPDGSLIYLVAARLEQEGLLAHDFPVDAGRPDGGTFRSAGLTQIDHIAQALPDDQLDSWVLFYRSVLGLEPETIFVLPDPYGLMRSRTVASRNRRLRLPLNISEGRNTATARSVSSFAGAGTAHIALATDDIFAAARALRANGVAILPIPGNYYDDLPTRFDLAPERIERLRAEDVLYDRSEKGEFFQLYTQPFQDRFFFEIVQRTGDYDVYGAANAPVRMAAQALARGRQGGDILEFL